MSTPLPPEEERMGASEPPSDDLLAAELVVGVLESGAHAAAQARAARDTGFASLVAAWERRLAPWLTDVAPVDPPAHIWDAIRQRLGWESSQSDRTSWWSSVSLWRTATAIVAVIAVAIWWSRVPPTTPPAAVVPAPGVEKAARPVTLLARDDGSPGWLASVDRTHGTVLMVPIPHAPDAAGRVPELWIIPAGQAPLSLGAVSVDKAYTVAVPAAASANLVSGSVLAITLEPAEGVPHAAPSGPIVAKGPLIT
jgi:anti-sigma-K factor RskA